MAKLSAPPWGPAANEHEAASEGAGARHRRGGERVERLAAQLLGVAGPELSRARAAAGGKVKASIADLASAIKAIEGPAAVPLEPTIPRN